MLSRHFYIKNIMRPRPWIFVLALIVTFLGLLMYHGWSLFKANERIKDYLVNQIQPVLGEKSEIETLDMALGAVHLKGVHIVTNDGRYELRIQDLRIGYSLINLIKNGFEPQKSPQDILFVQPELTIHYVEPSPHVNSSPEDSSAHHYLHDISKFDFLKRITLSRGSIVYSDSTGSITKLVNDINGWISTIGEPKTNVRLVGKLLDSEQFNTRLNGEIDLIRSKLNFLEVNITDFQLREHTPMFVPHYLNIHQGLINGRIIITEDAEERNFATDGEISIDDATITIEDKLTISDIDLDADIKDWDFIIRRSDQKLNGSPVTLQGKIKNILNPEFQVTIASDSLDLNQCLRNFKSDTPWNFYGNSHLTVAVTSSFRSPHIEGRFHSPGATFDGMEWDDINLDISFQDSLVHVKRIGVNHKTIRLNGDAWIDFTQPDSLIRLRLSSIGNVPSTYLPKQFKSLDDARFETNLKLSGNRKAFNGLFQVSLSDPDIEKGHLLLFNRLKLKNDRLTVISTNTDNHKILEGDVTFKKDAIEYKANLYDIHEIAYQIHELEALRTYFDFDSSLFIIKRENNKLTLSGDYNWKHIQESKRDGDIRIVLTDKKEEKIININTTARFGKQSYKGEGTVIKTDSLITIKNLAIEDLMNITGSFGLDDSSLLACKITFPNADLNRFYNILYPDNDMLTDGDLFGTIDINGSPSSPQILGKLGVNNTIINDIGLYDGYLEFNYHDRIFHIKTFDFNQNGELLFTFSGDYDQRIDDLDIRLSGKNVEMSNVLPTFTSNSNLLSGNASIDLNLTGKLNKPILIGDIAVTNGMLSRFHYDSLYVRFNGQQNSLSSDRFALDIAESRLIRHHDFEMKAIGTIPLSSDDIMNLTITGSGNLLSILPEITQFFKATASKSSWVLDLSGDPSSLSINRGELHIDDGYLELGAVAPKIRSINADIIIETDGFVHVKNLSGMIRSKPFTFKNFRADEVISAIDLEPFTIPNLDLNLGVFTVETSSQGVPLTIPGLMDEGEIGYFEFKGRLPQERFYAAGPAQRPYIRGKINLRNVNLMYPFAESSESTSSNNLVVNVLRSILWDVKAIPVKDIRYEKDFPSGVDKVYVNLSVDSDDDGLDFSGIIEDETFRVEGKLESTEGFVDYLDFDFRIERVGVEFDKSTLFPIAYGQAKAAIADSLGVLNHIFLTLLLEDEFSGIRQTRGRWGKIYFEISTDNPNIGITEGRLLASLGYSGDNIREKATDIIGISTDNLLFRPLFRPFERQLERTFNLDMVRLSSRFTRNFIEMNLWNKDYIIPNTNLYLLKSTRLMIGKYLIDDVLLSYTGQLESGMKYNIHGEELGLKHTLGLEYRINSNLLLEMEYNYNSFLIQREDKRIFLRHSFPIQ